MNNRTAFFVQAIRGPVVLITLGLLFAASQAGMAPFSRTWPLLLIVIGVMKLLERMVAPPGPPVPPPQQFPPPGGSWR